MLFKRRFHDGIRSGAITVTIRAWQSPQATPGKSYALAGSERIEVRAVDVVALSESRSRDARASGFASVDELVALLRKESSRRLTASTRVYRVRFLYLGEVENRAPGLTRGEVQARLERLGPWAREMLRWSTSVASDSRSRPT